MDEFVELAEAIDIIRDQLRMAQEAGAGRTPRFRVGKVEVELAVEARREGGAEGGVRFGVFTLAAKGGVASAATHRVKLELVPVEGDGGSFEVHGRVPRPPTE